MFSSHTVTGGHGSVFAMPQHRVFIRTLCFINACNKSTPVARTAFPSVSHACDFTAANMIVPVLF